MPAPLAPPGTLARDAPSRLEAIARAPSKPRQNILYTSAEIN